MTKQSYTRIMIAVCWASVHFDKKRDYGNVTYFRIPHILKRYYKIQNESIKTLRAKGIFIRKVVSSFPFTI